MGVADARKFPGRRISCAVLLFLKNVFPAGRFDIA
jgi:hypothetical protein